MWYSYCVTTSLQCMKRFEARQAVLEALKEKGLYVDTKDNPHGGAPVFSLQGYHRAYDKTSMVSRTHHYLYYVLQGHIE